MIFLFTEIDHPALLKERGTPEADHILSRQIFLIEEILAAHGVHWMKRIPAGVFSAFEGGEPAKAAIALQMDFQDHVWEGFGKGKIRAALHSGEAEKSGQSYVGPDVIHTAKLLEASWGGQILLTVPAVHFIPLPPGARLRDLGTHFLKDLSEPQNLYVLQHPDFHDNETPSPRSLQSFPQNFSPQNSAFFGREEEMGEITGMLTDSTVRLITLAGPGGFGKTRLALQTAAEIIEKFKDGVYMVALAPLLSDQLMVGSIANALKFFFFGSEDPKVQLLNHLKEKEMLLVMDNFEHIIEGAQLVKEILQAAPRLKILATSREKLRLEGEKVLEVRGLRYPDRSDGEEMEASSAVQLFLKSARRSKPDFTLKGEERESLLRICRLLEGMPLGLELSATWVATLSLPEIAEKIQNSQDFLATSEPHLPARHRSLRAVFEYSWILLSEEQKKILRCISAFKGGFSEQAARKIAGATEAALTYLENKSLVRKKSDKRFEVHELLKYYAKEKLFDDLAEKERVFDSHCAYFARWLHGHQKDLFGPQERHVLEVLVQEMGNIREGWNRALDKVMENEMADYLDCLFFIYETKGWFQEAKETFQRAAEILQAKQRNLPKLPSASLLLLARLISRWAEFEHNLGDIKKAKTLFEESLELFAAASAEKYSGSALAGLGMVNEAQGHYGKAKAYYEKSFKVFRQVKDGWGTAWILNQLSHIASLNGEFKKAQALVRKSLLYSEAHQDQRSMAHSYNRMGDVLHQLGQFEHARRYYEKGLSAYLESGDRRGISWSFTNLGREAQAIGDYAGARQMYRESMAISRDLGDIRALAWCDDLLGFVGWAMGEYKEALTLYEEGLFLYREVGDLRGEAWTLDLIGNLKLAQGDDQEAEKYYLLSSALLEKEEMSVENKGWHYFHLGDISIYRRRMEEAEGRFLKALPCFNRLRDKAGQAATLIHLGETACERKAYSLAERYLRKAVRITLEAHYMPKLVDALVAVAGLLKAQGDEHKAVSFLMVALSHPTCFRQTKDRMVSMVMDLEARFSKEEMEGGLIWAKTIRIEDVAFSWLDSGKPVRSPSKKNKKKLKPSSRSRRKVKGKPRIHRKSKPKRRK